MSLVVKTDAQTAVGKTNALERKNIAVGLMDKNDLNPNEMSDAEFNRLYANIEDTGCTDPILVRKIGGRYRIVGGHHRFEVCKLLDFDEVPCTVITDPSFDDDQEKYQVVRMNMIRGKLNPKKFLQLYESLDKKYEAEIMAEAFGFADQEQFEKLVGQMAKTLPKEMQGDFKQAANEIKTIDGLSKLLNSMFSRYGDTLDHGYMVFDYGGKDSVWLRMGNDTRKAVLTLGKLCVTEKRTMDDVLGGLVRMAAAGKLEAAVLQLIADSPSVIPKGAVPTYEQGSVVDGTA